jgi:hypothetical protein
MILLFNKSAEDRIKKLSQLSRELIGVLNAESFTESRLLL